MRSEGTIVKLSHPEGAIRELKGYKIFGWCLIGAGLLLFLLALVAEPNVFVPTVVFAGIFGLMGAFLLIHYRNWYILFRAEDMVSRGSFGKLAQIRYDAVKSCKTYSGRGNSQLRIRGRDGARMSINTSVVDVHRLMATIEYHSQRANPGQPQVYSIPTVVLYGQSTVPPFPY